MDQVEPTNGRMKKLLLLYRPGLNPSCYPRCIKPDTHCPRPIQAESPPSRPHFPPHDPGLV